ncbi:hypothetical protein [Cylindrospermum sp. FACHB-282]|uniref:hypothetical protein n=1 Tax=Cylindrospermum sp. FACHB-282 TaxID=2692794 RepID=UPI0016842971|nr:hypothetical protein [Cylindrospermum sp. FACHB-282]MBD2384489.1 hypothetical protein [Cylindrospermum sp. FACHB-282]
MFYELIEQELSDGQPWSMRQQTQLPMHIQILIERENTRPDIWELPNPQIKKLPKVKDGVAFLRRQILSWYGNPKLFMRNLATKERL